jgi:hypothetical protein
MGPDVILRSNNPQDRMSVLGQKRTLRGVRPMSALPQKRTLIERVGMSALCQKQTFRAAAESGAIRSPRRRGRTAFRQASFRIMRENASAMMTLAQR